MNRLFKNSFFASLLLVFSVITSISSCTTVAATVSEQNKAQVEQNRVQGLPLWASCNFKSEEASAYIPGYKTNEKGLFASGTGTSATSARVTARANLAYYCKTTYKYTNSASSETLLGSRIIDSFTASDGTVYVLMFISEKDAKKSFGG